MFLYTVFITTCMTDLFVCLVVMVLSVFLVVVWLSVRLYLIAWEGHCLIHTPRMGTYPL